MFFIAIGDNTVTNVKTLRLGAQVMTCQQLKQVQ